MGQSGGLTARDAGRRAAQTSVQASVAREQVLTAKNDRARVIWDNLPKLTLSAQYTRLSAVDTPVFALPGGAATVPFPTGPLDNYALSANLTVPFTEYLLRLVSALNGAGANEEAALLTERATRAGAAANAKLTYYDWVRVRLQRVVAEQALEQAKAQLRRVEALHSAGRAAEADLLQARAFQADAELALSQADTLLAIGEQRVRTALHAPPEEQLSVGENVLAPFPGAEEPRSLEDLYREAESQRLELQSFDKGSAALDRLHTVERTRALPRLDGFGNITYANPNQRIFPQQSQWDETWQVGLSLTWATGDLGNSITAAESARSQRQQVLHQRALAVEGMRLDIAGAYRALAQARLNVVTAEQGERAAVAAAEARARLEEQGLATALELMQARTAQVQARLNFINAHIALRVARVQLDHALGRDANEGG
jgi:outer membrane protein